MILIIVLYALLALTFIFSKIAVTGADPLFFVSVRTITAGLILLSIDWVLKRRAILKHKEKIKKIDSRDLIDFAQVTLFHVYLAFILSFWAYQYVTSTKANILYALTPFISMLLGYSLYCYRVTMLQIIGAVIAFAGLLPLMLHGGRIFSGCLLCVSWPDIVLLAGVTSAAYAWFIIKRLAQRGYTLFYINGAAMFFGGLCAGITWIIINRGLPVTSPIYSWPEFLIGFFGLIIVSNIVVYNLYGWLLHSYSINTLSVFGLLTPMFGAFYGYMLLGEQLSWHYVPAVIGLSVGLIIFTRKTKA